MPKIKRVRVKSHPRKGLKKKKKVKSYLRKKRKKGKKRIISRRPTKVYYITDEYNQFLGSTVKRPKPKK